ncbi:unnamed protein product [Cyprideis torosa]|uniref:Uncharacterized protein n=1 Tax=Cyprideis torosa TaxID=163714 RepID=A0A7R8WGZ6_9CRUS|nr:unnamed protein product [Cyprideis torosa]CAG0898738.1 unnamed protein product [Cyprideis torosa]
MSNAALPSHRWEQFVILPPESVHAIQDLRNTTLQHVLSKILGDSCNDDQECAASILNGICNATTNVCDCVEGKDVLNNTACPSCPSGWIFFPETSKCYFFSNTATMKWTNAEEYCTSFGTTAHLVSIHSQIEADFILASVSSVGWHWTGGTDVAVEGVWAYTDGTPFDFFNWESGRGFRGRDYNCLEFRTSAGAMVFADWECDGTYSSFPFVCNSIPN